MKNEEKKKQLFVVDVDLHQEHTLVIEAENTEEAKMIAEEIVGGIREDRGHELSLSNTQVTSIQTEEEYDVDFPLVKDNI
jgi:hypothetical protein